MTVCFKVANQQSDIYVERDIRYKINEYVDLNRKVLILSDDGVPRQYVDVIVKQCPESYIKIVPHGENSKSLETVEQIVMFMADNNFDKDDLLFAVGGGVIGDLGGFIASIYLNGIQVVSLPTTSLSQIDSSIGGKTAVNMGHIKNVVGSFYQPSKVFIDMNTLSTLTKREYYSGLVEALKAGMICDSELFEIFVSHIADFEKTNPPVDVEEIILRSLYVKRDVVEQDEKEMGLRKILNFGHTLGHAIEGINMNKYYHGECVGLGMLMILENQEIKQQVKMILEKMGLPTHVDYDIEEVLKFVKNDKKFDGSMITIIQVDEIGKGYLKEVELDRLRKHMEENRL